MRLSLPNPCVFQRELVGLSRQRKLLFARLLMLVPCAWVLLMLHGDGLGGLASQGRNGFTLLIYLELAAIAIVIPALTANIIAEELERNTLQLLLLTRQAPGRVLLQKLMSRILATLTLLLLPLPLLITLTCTSGVSFDMLISGLLTLLLAFELCLLGSLMASWFTRTVIAAYLMSYVVIAGMLYFMHTALMVSQNWRSYYGFPLPWRLVQIDAIIGLVILPIACLITFRRMTTAAMHTPPGVSLYNRYSRALGRLRTWGRPLVADVSLDSQPILWREYHQRFYASNSFILRFLALLMILIMALILLWDAYVVDGDAVLEVLYRSYFHIDHMMQGLIHPAIRYLPALIPLLLGISVITREERCHSLDSLRVTQLSDNAIFGAKLWLVLKVSLLFTAIKSVVSGLPFLLRSLTYDYQYDSRYSPLYGLEPHEILTRAILILSLILLIASVAMHSAMQRRRFLPALLQAIACLGLLTGAYAILWRWFVVLYKETSYDLFNCFFAMLGAVALWKLALKLLAVHDSVVVKVIYCFSGGAGIWLFVTLLTRPQRSFAVPDFEPALAAWALAHLMLWLAWRRASSWLRPA